MLELSRRSTVNRSDTVCHLMVCPQYYPIIGGYERLAETLAGRLRHRGVNSAVVTRRLSSKWSSYSVYQGVPVYRLSACPRRYLDGPVWFLSLLLFLMRSGGDVQIIHVHQIGWGMVAAVAFARAFDRRVVVQPHSGGGATVQKVNESRSAGLFRFAVGGCDAAIALSEELAAQLRALGVDREKIHYIPNAVDTARFKPRCEGVAEHQTSESKKTVLFVGRLTDGKGLEDLLVSWAAVREQKDNCSLTVVGSGPMKGKLVTLSQELGIDDSVEFAGAVAEGIEEYYRSASLFVLPSYREGVPLALLEAMSSGLPVVATSIPNVKDIVDHAVTGYVVPPGDREALSSVIVHALEDSRDSAMPRLAREVVLQRFSLEDAVSRLVALYAELAGPNWSGSGDS